MLRLMILKYRLHLTRYAIDSCRQMIHDAEASIEHYEHRERKLLSAIAMARTERKLRVAR